MDCAHLPFLFMLKNLLNLYIMRVPYSTISTGLYADFALQFPPGVPLNPQACWFTMKQVKRDQYQQWLTVDNSFSMFVSSMSSYPYWAVHHWFHLSNVMSFLNANCQFSVPHTSWFIMNIILYYTILSFHIKTSFGYVRKDVMTSYFNITFWLTLKSNF